MNVIRRVYQYLIAFAGLAMLSVGVANLGWVLVEILVPPPAGLDEVFVREQVAQWTAVALVGLPVWLVHWTWAQRQAAASPEERASALRRLYVYAALAGALLAGSTALDTALRDLLALVDGSRRVSLHDVLSPLPAIVVAAVVWVFHWRVARADRALVGERGASATLRRWYLYGAALVGLVVALEGGHRLLTGLWLAVADPTAVGRTAFLSAAAPDALVGLLVWLAHWRWLPQVLGPEAQAEDRRSTLRSVYLFLGLAVAVAGTLVGASQLLYYALGRLLGVQEPGGVGGNLLLAAAGPASVTLVYGVGWLYQRTAIRAQAATTEAARQASVRRLYTYLVALLALAALAAGVGGLLWSVVDAATSPSGSSGDWWRDRIALFATLTIVALPVWLTHWRPTSAVAAEDARSLSRRLYVYLALIGGALALLGSAATALYRLLSLALGTAPSATRVTDLLHALAVAVVASVVMVYHWRTARADARRAPPPEPARPAVAELLVRLRAAESARLEAALGTLRQQGVEVEVVGPPR